MVTPNNKMPKRSHDESNSTKIGEDELNSDQKEIIINSPEIDYNEKGEYSVFAREIMDCDAFRDIPQDVVVRV